MTEKLKLRLVEAERSKPVTTDNELYEALEEIIAIENQKPLKETDTDLISECVSVMLDIQGVDIAELIKEDKERTERIKASVRK